MIKPDNYQQIKLKQNKITLPSAFLIAFIIIVALHTMCLFHKKTNYNIILITIDTLRADHLGCYGYPRETSPFIDYLARNGVLFEHAFSSISHTAPSHASIFTSLFPVQHKLLENGGVLHASAFTMAELFKDIGYETAGFCSVGFLKNLRQGFDVFDNEKYKKLVHYRQAHHTINSVLEWLSSKKHNAKFFLWVHLYDPHLPYHPLQQYLKQMKLRSETEKELFVKYLTEICKLPRDFYGRRAKLIKDYNNYDAEILFVDQEIKRLFRSVERKGFKSNILWIITADHGEGLGNHHFYGHSVYIYNEQMHVPLIFSFNNKAYAGLRIKNLVRHVDILPTICDLLGYRLQDRTKFVQGFSLLPLLRNSNTSFPVEFAFYQRKPWDKIRPKMERGMLFKIFNLNIYIIPKVKMNFMI